jgi:hypothetical protein
VEAAKAHKGKMSDKVPITHTDLATADKTVFFFMVQYLLSLCESMVSGASDQNSLSTGRSIRGR